MDRLLAHIKVPINEKIYLKDPETSALGKKIVEHSISLIHDIGFEQFTFKKLSHLIGSTESSVYRYFENKHKLLLYLSSWYWGWVEYRLVFATHGMQNSVDKIAKAISVITAPVELDHQFSHINEVLLKRIVISEFSKSYLTKEVDKENQEGYFSIYKRLAHRLSEMITDIQPHYTSPMALATTILEGSLHQQFLMEHFPSLSNFKDDIAVGSFYTDLVLTQLGVQHGA